MTDRPTDAVRRRPDKQQDRPEGRPTGSPTAREEITEESIAADRRAARERLRRQDHQHRHATACELAGMRMAVFYGPRPLLRIGLGELLTWRWAA